MGLWSCKNNSLRLALLIGNSGMCLKMVSTARSIVSLSGILVKRLSTSNEIKNLFWDWILVNSFTNENECKWHHLLISMHLKCKHRTTFCCKLRLHKCPYSRVMTNLARTPKSAIFWDFAKGGPRENAQKSRPTIGASKTPWRKWHHLIINMHLKCKHRTTFCCKLRLHKCPYSRVMTNLARTPKSAIFWDFAKGGTKGKCSKK